MSCLRAPFERVSSLCSSSLCPFIPISLYSPSPLLSFPVRSLNPIVSVSASQSQDLSTASLPSSSTRSESRWKPMCLYYTQEKCTKMDDPMHLEKFSHNCSRDLQVDFSNINHMRPQNLDFFLVLDLEGRIEILEFPVLMIDARNLGVVDFFHRFVRPTKMSEQRINEYIEGKYGNFGVDRVWHDTAIPFKDVLQQFEAWLTHHDLWTKEHGGFLKRSAFITWRFKEIVGIVKVHKNHELFNPKRLIHGGNWDLKTKVPQQCEVSKINVPTYFMEWINLKDAYLNFYKRRATGMMTMMKELKIPLVGSHHLGFDDTKNISRVLQRMLADGAVLQITARRNLDQPESVEFLFKNRIR